MFSFGFLDSDSEDEKDAIKKENKIRKKIRQTSSPLNLSDISFKRRFRLNKTAFQYVLNEIRINKGKRKSKTSPTLALAMTLELLAKGSYQDTIGNDFSIGMAQPTVSKIFWEVVEKMERNLCSKWIKFELSSETTEHFFNKYKIPGVVGCIDGRHVYLLRPSSNEHMFFNRKGKHSINVMIICDHEQKILAINPIYGGKAHDSFVWSLSSERQFFENKFLNRQRNIWLLRDSAYPLEPWLLTPYRNTNDADEIKFNEVHSSARSLIENCIGVLKGRWRILLEERRTRYSPEKVAKIVNVCAALHNICIYYKISLNDSLPPVEDSEDRICSTNNLNYKQIAIEIRDRIKNSLRC